MASEGTHQSIRLFENDLLERLSHVHPITPLLFWSPVAAWLLWRGQSEHALGAATIALLAVGGILTWTFTEYLLHRFLFHFPARSRFGQWLVFLFHGNHHEDPRDKTRLVMPPAGAIPIMLVLYLLFSLLLPAAWLDAFCAFFIVGYLIYDYIHYATHHFPMRNPVAKYLKHYHLKHHYAREGGRFGVSSPLWDIVFGTRPAGDKRPQP
jgi:sterol desaturase/sphingolipid hydroxylase (fatty acid hydroxylase superfamily)